MPGGHDGDRQRVLRYRGRIDDAANEITVATPISWSAGDPVNLPYEGAAPDNGAFESASTGPSVPKLLKVEPLPS